eukprot:11370-Heterococcus_DN1.PRE.4
MLDQNLVGSFHKTPEFAAAQAQYNVFQHGSELEAAIVAEEFDRLEKALSNRMAFKKTTTLNVKPMSPAHTGDAYGSSSATGSAKH